MDATQQTPDHSSPARARRASRGKSKLGCQDCKLRRIKCDETRPECRNCVKTGRACAGYPGWNPRSRFGPYVEISIPIAPRPSIRGESLSSSTATSPAFSAATSSPRATSEYVGTSIVRATPRTQKSSKISIPVQALTPLVQSPSDAQPLNDLEGQYYRIFRTRTAGELSGFFDSDFWTRIVLQESHSEASIKHAVIALGALYKTQHKLTESPPSSPEMRLVAPRQAAPDHYRHALEQYGKSLSRLREALETKEIRSRRTILMSIVLFTCFQSFTGDHTSAITQIQHGLRLLEERELDRRKPECTQNRDDVETEMIQMFTRLAIQAKSYDMAFHFPHPYVIRLTPTLNPPSPSTPHATPAAGITIPAVFVSVQQARSALDTMMKRMMRFNEALSSVYMGPNGILPDQIKSTGFGFRHQLEAWQMAFHPILINRRRSGVSSTERAGINVLRMTQLMTVILLSMSYSTSEKDFDDFSNEFKEITQLATEVVVDEEVSLATSHCGNNCRHKYSHHGATGHGSSTRSFSSYSHIKASFALDLGIIPPLFVVGTKCRDRKLRREAINLLTSSPRREGMWDSVLCGRVAGWIMGIEEEGLRAYEPKGKTLEVVAGGNRIMVKEILFNMQTRRATLRRGTRGAREGDFDARARETDINW